MKLTMISGCPGCRRVERRVMTAITSDRDTSRSTTRGIGYCDTCHRDWLWMMGVRFNARNTRTDNGPSIASMMGESS